MRNRLILGLCLAACAACVPSLHPLYTGQELVYEAALEGLWVDPESDERWNFQRAGEKSYRLVISDEDSWGTFDARLLKVGERYFLDLFPVDWDDPVNKFHRANLIAAHAFLSVRQISPRLEMAAIDGSWLKDHLVAHPHALAHEIVEDQIVLTAQPVAMQAFFSEHFDQAFDDYGTLTRPK